jgi:hypothetical protein
MLIALSILAAAAQAPTAVTAPADDPIVCKGRSESVVGTRIKPKKTCMKQSDWAYIEKHTQEELRQINERGNNPGPALGRKGGPE